MSGWGIDRIRQSAVKILGPEGVAGSGFIIRSDGYVITCHHVIYRLASIRVEHQGTIFEQVEWCEHYSDPDTDVAILKLEAEGLTPLPIANPAELPSSVIVYGFPQSKAEQFDDFEVVSEKISASSRVKTLSTYYSADAIEPQNPWNRLPDAKASFLSHKLDASVDSGTSGGPVFSESLGAAVGVIQSNAGKESYAIRWDNLERTLVALGLEPERNAIREFLDAIERHFSCMRLFHCDREVLLEDQYIPIQVSVERRDVRQVESVHAYSAGEAQKRAYAMRPGDGEGSRKDLPWEEARSEHQKIMVLADPGMGKSTVLKMEASRRAKAEKEKLKDSSIAPAEVVFPLFLQLFDLAHTEDELIDAIPKVLVREYRQVSAIQDRLRDSLASGRCLLLLDALDEVPSSGRNSLSEKLNRFVRNYPCPVICTSRIVGYSEGFLAGAKHMEIVPFRTQQIELYVKTWFRNAASQIEDRTKCPDGLIKELRVRPQVAGLVQNPLLLSLICSLYQHEKIVLPAKRAKVYEMAVSFILDEWACRRKRPPRWALEPKLLLLEDLAYRFSCAGRQIFSRDDLYEKVNRYLQDPNSPTDFLNEKAAGIVEELAETHGVLQKLDRNGSRYIFLHRTFQEYFTASYLKRKVEEDAKGLALLHERFWDFDWHEVLALVAGMLDDPALLLDRILREKDDVVSSLLLLAGRCAAECSAESRRDPCSAVDSVIDRVFDLWSSEQRGLLARSTIVALGQSHPHLLDRIISALEHGDDPLRRSAAEALGKIGDVRAVDALLNALEHGDNFLRRSAAMALGKIGDGRAVDALVNALEHGVYLLRLNAAGALWQIGDGRAVDALLNAFEHGDNFLRGNAAMALGQIGDGRAVDALVNALEHGDDSLREYAAMALGLMGDGRAVDALVNALEHGDDSERWRAAMALEKIGKLEVLEKIINRGIDTNKPSTLWLIKALVVKFNREDSAYIPAYPELFEGRRVKRFIRRVSNWWSRDRQESRPR
ncbi:MAG: HEAT repeat domain-containing protein [Syntrophobacter sp.]